jgi:hypothetical protein
MDRIKNAWLQKVTRKDNLSKFILKLKNVKKSLKKWEINLRGLQFKRKKGNFD